jgi:hypothetical protein
MYIENKITNKIPSQIVSKRVEDKTFTLQFLPECLYHIENIKTINYKETKLKTDYLIDIIHSLILKYYFKKENRFAINATVLKDKYGYLYNYYINYLIDNNIIALMTQYQTGVTSRIYSLDDSIFTSKIKRYKNYDKVLLRKYKGKFVEMVGSSIDEKESLIDIDVKEKLVSDLFSVNIEFDRAIFFLDSLKYQDYDIYNRNVYSVECINNKHIFYHFDAYGRMHTNYTILKSFIRKNCLMIDGEETCELDISNSQPLFLSKIIRDSGTKWVDQNEFELFSYLVESGGYYEYMMSKSKFDKNIIKKMTYKVLFGRNRSNNKCDILFESNFPTIHNFIKLYKKEFSNYKILAYDLQKMESNLIFNNIIKTIINIYPDIKIITIHDSIVFPMKYREIVKSIFNEKLKELFNNYPS